MLRSRLSLKWRFIPVDRRRGTGWGGRIPPRVSNTYVYILYSHALCVCSEYSGSGGGWKRKTRRERLINYLSASANDINHCLERGETRGRRNGIEEGRGTRGPAIIWRYWPSRAVFLASFYLFFRVVHFVSSCRLCSQTRIQISRALPFDSAAVGGNKWHDAARVTRVTVRIHFCCGERGKTKQNVNAIHRCDFPFSSRRSSTAF